MEATVKVEMDNAAFEDAPATELGRILRKLADEVENDGASFVRLMDSNGNKVGTFIINE